MARGKKFLSFKLPILNKKFKVDRRTFATVIGLLLFGLSAILFLSFIQSGQVLTFINEQLTYRFGAVSLMVPILFLLLATHFFHTKQLQLITYNVTLGFFLLGLSLMGMFKTGVFGRFIYENLSIDFSVIGAYLLLLIIFVVGLIVFFNTSLDTLLLFFAQSFQFIVAIFQETFEGKKTPATKGGKPEFIQDLSHAEHPQAPPVTPVPVKDSEGGVSEDGMKIRSFSTKLYGQWKFPPHDLLVDEKGNADYGDPSKNAEIIERTLESFGIYAKVVEFNKGPTVSQYALNIARGTKLTKITTLSNDLALALAAVSGQVRIEAPIPGRGLVGIEIPNMKAKMVTLREMLDSPALEDRSRPLLVPLGLEVSGKVQVADISTMPHVLVAGTTGSGKSVLLNSWITTFMMRTTPEQLRLILVDPKRVEFSSFNKTPHLQTNVIVDNKETISALKWTIKEMERRYHILAEKGARNIVGYNSEKTKEEEHLPYIVFVIDELADLMMFAGKEVEDLITRIAQKARAVGIHLILATQRPSVDVITGLMKANIPTRIAFNVPSLVDSRVVLDTPGAEKLLGKGDMLYLAADQPKPRRMQSAYVSEKEVSGIVSFLRENFPEVHYTEEVTEQEVTVGGRSSGGSSSSGGNDPLFQEALQVVLEAKNASSSFLQRKLSIGYARAARILDELHAAGYVGPAKGSKAREILYKQ